MRGYTHDQTYEGKHFYTSDFYLDTEVFRKLDVHFTNHKMRDIFDTLVFLSSDGEQYTKGLPLLPEVKAFVKKSVLDPEVVLARYQLRDKFMSKSEALLHSDFHTSNVFLGQDEMKVIDMEYAFCGPTKSLELHAGEGYYTNRNLLHSMKALETDAPIDDIAKNCGFSSASYFATKFKEIYRITPTQFRQQEHT